MRRRTLATFWAFLAALAGCGKTDEDAERARVEHDMKQWLQGQVHEFRLAAEAVQRAAPTPTGRGWSATEDAEALRAMRDAWRRARTAYERVEGALAPLFPESDVATDARYDDFLATLGAVGDPAPFDDRGVVGAHAIERILWADRVPPEVVGFERGLPGYRPAAFPSSEAEARQFKEQLAGRLVSDLQRLEQELTPLQLDIAFAFRGLMDLTNEQLEKVDRAATGREESRYAQATLADLRANREGCRKAYEMFRPWLRARGRAELDARVQAAFERLRVSYDGVAGAAIPRPPQGWSSLQPRPEHLTTPFGQLFQVVSRETDEAQPRSLSAGLMSVADALALPKAVLR